MCGPNIFFLLVPRNIKFFKFCPQTHPRTKKTFFWQKKNEMKFVYHLRIGTVPPPPPPFFFFFFFFFFFYYFFVNMKKIFEFFLLGRGEGGENTYFFVFLFYIFFFTIGSSTHRYPLRDANSEWWSPPKNTQFPRRRWQFHAAGQGPSCHATP